LTILAITVILVISAILWYICRCAFERALQLPWCWCYVVALHGW